MGKTNAPVESNRLAKVVRKTFLYWWNYVNDIWNPPFLVVVWVRVGNSTTTIVHIDFARKSG